jgi:hypothetical protein
MLEFVLHFQLFNVLSWTTELFTISSLSTTK